MSIWSRIERRINDAADRLVLDEHRGQIDAAKVQMEAGEMPAAITTLEGVLAQKGDHGQALILLGEARMASKAPMLAKEAFDKALGVRGNDPSALVGAGQASVAMGDYEAAIVPLGRAIAEAGGDRGILADAYRALGVAWRRRGDLDKAIRELRKAVAEDTDDLESRACLGEALVTDGGPYDEAKRHLGRASDGESPLAVALYGLGRMALIEDMPAEAEAKLARARERSSSATALDAAIRFDIFLAQGDAALANKDPIRAHAFYLEALQENPKRGDVHAKIAATHRTIGNLESAMGSFERALALGADGDTLKAAVDTAIAAGDSKRGMAWANDLLTKEPENTRALVANGIALVADGGDSPSARTLLDIAASRDDVDAHVALARLDLETAPSKAAAHALAALRLSPHHAKARQLLADARERELPAPASNEMAEIAKYLERVVASRRESGHLVGDVARAAANLDAPLLVTVMGEFSSGKSSFVNAFIGADVAPTGITPTTATINVVRYGRERGGRVIGRDGTTIELGWDAFMAHLRALKPDAAKQIDRVEILVPLPQLEKINIVDTPGLNSIQPEHEATARAFIAKADAVVWVFTASQGGKSSERKALESIRAEGKRVLGVLNKADTLSTSEIDEVTTFIGGQLGELVEAIVPFSARRALAWKYDPTGSSDGNWEKLYAALEERFFTQARQLKRDACTRALKHVVATAQADLADVRAKATAAADAARTGRDELSRAGRRFVLDIVVAERKAVSEQMTTLYRRAAREVLDLVRPRRLPFSSNSATSADRDYLIALLSSGFESAIESGRHRVAADLAARTRMTEAARALGAALATDVAGDLERVASDRIGLAMSRVYDRARAYVRGYIDGGHVDQFFRNDVPNLQLNEDDVYHKLVRAAPNLDRELGEPLERAAADAMAALATRLEHWAAVVDVQAFDLDVGVGRALDLAAARLTV